DPDTQRLMDRRAGEIAIWKVHWLTPFMMASLFILGILGALSHHFFYRSLDGKLAKNQITLGRIGTALAFFTKSTLIGSVLLSYRQRIWHTVRTRSMTIGGIDALFAVAEDPGNFFNGEMLRNAKLAAFMALATWFIPLAAVLAPASLTSGVVLSEQNTTCPNVPTLNFTQEAKYNFRNPTSFPGNSMTFYNTTDRDGEDPGWFDYFDQPSKNARRLTLTSIYMKRAVVGPDAGQRSCDGGWNCTYTLNFVGPGYSCEEVAHGVGGNTSELAIMGAPFNTSKLAPEGIMIYLADVDAGEYQNPQLPTDNHGEPIQKHGPWPDDLGVFKGEPVLWIGYSIDTGRDWPEDTPSSWKEMWDTERVPSILKCIHYVTNYTVHMNFTEGQHNATVLNRDYLRPIINTTVNPGIRWGENLTFMPESEFVRPTTDVGRYKITAAYHALGQLLRGFLRGSIAYDSNYPLTRSDISETRLVDQRTSYPVANLIDMLQAVYEDMILTLLSDPHLQISSTTSVPCTKNKAQNVFHYYASGLWIGYAIVVAFTLIFLVVGSVSIWQNGVTSDTSFSRIMVTTRNPTLDRISVGACLGGDPFPAELKKTRLRFGILEEDDDNNSDNGEPRPSLSRYGGGRGLFGRVEHVAFGTEGETRPIVKYGTYAGLKKWR
ncbi:hypothetical protein M501DRAFT_906253, partial [Patellaria atrata CBS 101060]